MSTVLGVQHKKRMHDQRVAEEMPPKNGSYGRCRYQAPPRETEAFGTAAAQTQNIDDKPLVLQVRCFFVFNFFSPVHAGGLPFHPHSSSRTDHRCLA